MIPASYLFKDAFQKAWYEPDIEAAIERQKPSGHPIGTWTGRFLASLRQKQAAAPAGNPLPDRP